MAVVALHKIPLSVGQSSSVPQRRRRTLVIFIFWHESCHSDYLLVLANSKILLL